MPSKSKKQQRLMGMVHAFQKGELKDASPEVKKIAKSMDYDDAKHFAETKHKGLPEKVKKKKKKNKKNESVVTFDSFVNEGTDRYSQVFLEKFNGISDLSDWIGRLPKLEREWVGEQFNKRYTDSSERKPWDWLLK